MQYVQHIQHIQHRYIDTLIHWYIIRDRDGSRLYGLNHWTKLFVTPRCAWYLKMGYTAVVHRYTHEMAMFFLGNSYHWTIGLVARLWLAMALRLSGTLRGCAGLRIGSCRLSSSRAAIFGLGALWGPAWSQMDVLMVYIFLPSLIQCWKGFVRLENISFRRLTRNNDAFQTEWWHFDFSQPLVERAQFAQLS